MVVCYLYETSWEKEYKKKYRHLAVGVYSQLASPLSFLLMREVWTIPVKTMDTETRVQPQLMNIRNRRRELWWLVYGMKQE